MTASRRSLLAAAVASIAPACKTQNSSPTHDPVAALVQLSQEANAALLRGDGAGYGALITHAADYTLMSPFGGAPTHGAFTPERLLKIGHFFKNGSLRQELVQAYGSSDMVALATIEHATVEVGGLPAQDWALRVTLIYRRVGGEWQLVHRHADPLSHAIDLQKAAALGRGDATWTPTAGAR